MKPRLFFSRYCLVLSLSCLFVCECNAGVITGGSAAWNLNEGTALSLFAFDAYFDQTTSRSDALTLAAPGNSSFSRPSLGQVQLVDSIRPFGAPVSPDPGTPGLTRSPQKTTLDIENAGDILGSWSASSNDLFNVGTSSLGEQIAFTSIQRWAGPILYGDFALRYDPTRAVGSVSGLVLTNNIDFVDAAFADLSNVTFGIAGNQLTINGNLLISDALPLLDASAIKGTQFGTFSMTANLSSSAVPEPSTFAVLAIGSIMGGISYRRRMKSRSLESPA